MLALAAAFVVAAVAWLYVSWLNRTVEEERERLAAAATVEVEERELRAPVADGFTLYLNSADVRATALFDGARYLATSGGLVAVDDEGAVALRYTTLEGLPENDLTALAVFRDRLFIGTASSGLVAFDGNEFKLYRFVRPAASRISVLVPTDSELLIGTFDGGLLEFDGERFSRRVSSASGADFGRVTALLPIDSRLYVGTHDRGLYIWREARIERLDTAEGLPSPRVTGLSPIPGRHRSLGLVAVATDFGVIGLGDSNEVKRLSPRPNVTSLAASGDHVWAGLFTGGMVDLTADLQSRDSPGGSAVNSSTMVTPGLDKSLSTVVTVSEDALWALTLRGAYLRSGTSSRLAFEAVGGTSAGTRLLTGRHITGMAVDGSGRLWVGYFDDGMDLIVPDSGERLTHIEDDRVREVNSVTYDREQNRLLVGTSRGLAVIGGALKPVSRVTDVMTRERNGLASDSVAHVIGTANRSLVLATAGGLTELSGGRARSLTAFHGLPSNHLYCSASLGSRVFVGSLAGLVEMEALRVIRIFKTSDSPLGHDWVTALAGADGTLFIGTNGGGVDALLPTGDWVNFSAEIGRFEVNQNAMHYDGKRLYVGTTDRGLMIYNPQDRRWSRISAGLAATNVTALASDERFLYVGTANGLSRIDKERLSDERK